MERADLILLVLIGLSVFIGLFRGLSDEILRLVVYVLSCVSGYALIPVFQPFFSSVPGEAEQRSLAVFSGTIAVWFVLRIMASFLTRKIKKSSFRELDRSLGAVFGGLRAGIVLLLLNLIFGLFAPHIVQSSRILTLSSSYT